MWTSPAREAAELAATLRRGTVTAVTERHPQLVRLAVDGAAAVAYPALTGPLALGDEVLVNTQATELGLGTGGFDVVAANLTRGLGLAPAPGAHVMAHPYAPLQAAVRHAEEDGPLALGLDGLPVVCCSLHSQVAPVAAALGAGRGTVYVQLGGGALPVALSDSLRALKAAGLVHAAVAVAPCFAGDVQAVSTASALLWAKARGARTVICGIGPGVVGTGSAFGHGGLAAAEAANAAEALGGRAVLAARVSSADPRERHRGLSHHTLAVLALCLGSPLLAWPEGVDGAPAGEQLGRAVLRPALAAGWEAACAVLPLAHMGRGPAADPDFFAAAWAAGRVAAQLADAAGPGPEGSA